MKTFKQRSWLSRLAVLFTLASSLTWLSKDALADPAPGEDPIIITNRVSHNMLPLNAPQRSPVNTNPQEIPAWLDAKLARYQAKAYSSDTTGITTDKDVTTTISNDGLRKTCTQDIGSNVGGGAVANRLGVKSDPQIVVMRGDLVNICK